MKIKLGKTRDSRSRRKAVKPINIEEVEQLKAELIKQTKFAAYLLHKGYGINTTQRYVKDVETFINWAEQKNIPIEQTSYNDVLHYIQIKRKQVKQRTISIYINSIKHYFNYLAITNQTLENPTIQIQIKGIKRKILYDILSKQELESLYENYQAPKEDSKNKKQIWFKNSQLVHQRNKVILGLIIYQGVVK
jgi:integrase/recombinase XerD